jgi:dihydropyrimidinase
MDLLHHDGDYSPWEGWRVRGWPATTILRGQVVVDGGELHAEPGFGRFVPRTLDPEVLARPAF